MMAGAIKFLEDGTVTTPRGFSAGATYAGLKTFAEDKLDLGLILSEAPCSAAGVYTTSTIRSSGVTVTQEHLKDGPMRPENRNGSVDNGGPDNPTH